MVEIILSDTSKLRFWILHGFRTLLLRSLRVKHSIQLSTKNWCLVRKTLTGWIFYRKPPGGNIPPIYCKIAKKNFLLNCDIQENSLETHLQCVFEDFGAKTHSVWLPNNSYTNTNHTLTSDTKQGDPPAKVAKQVLPYRLFVNSLLSLRQTKSIQYKYV